MDSGAPDASAGSLRAMPSQRFRNRVAIITGAGAPGGIGVVADLTVDGPDPPDR